MTALHIAEYYHGFYTSSLEPALPQTLDDVLAEAIPRPYAQAEAAEIEWESQMERLVAVPN